jgi:photosynthetic reaction center H subunit
MSTVILGDFDIAQLVLYLFWLFFIGLVIYLQKENMREGYPLESEITGKPIMVGPFMPLPKAKTFKLPHGHGDVSDAQHRQGRGRDRAPEEPRDAPDRAVVRLALRADRRPDGRRRRPGRLCAARGHPRAQHRGRPRIVPLRAYNDWSIAEEDSDIRGWPVRGCDGKEAGTVKDLWVDRSDSLFRYIEIDLGERSVLCPFFAARVEIQGKLSASTRSPRRSSPRAGPRDERQITLLEEEKVQAYYAGGKLYGSPSARSRCCERA